VSLGVSPLRWECQLGGTRRHPVALRSTERRDFDVAEPASGDDIGCCYRRLYGINIGIGWPLDLGIVHNFSWFSLHVRHDILSQVLHLWTSKFNAMGKAAVKPVVTF
jgi:hypothetical protein